MNVQAGNLALVFGPERDAGKVVRVLWPHDVVEVLGYRWCVRFRGEGEGIIPDGSMMLLDVDPRGDPGARELLNEAGKVEWDRWFAPPNVDF